MKKHVNQTSTILFTYTDSIIISTANYNLMSLDKYLFLLINMGDKEL